MRFIVTLSDAEGVVIRASEFDRDEWSLMEAYINQLLHSVLPNHRLIVEQV